MLYFILCLADAESYFMDFAKSVRRAVALNLSSRSVTEAQRRLEEYVEARMDDNTKRLLEEAFSSKEEEKLVNAMEVWLFSFNYL